VNQFYRDASDAVKLVRDDVMEEANYALRSPAG
jgi:hypothetical protein